MKTLNSLDLYLLTLALLFIFSFFRSILSLSLSFSLLVLSFLIFLSFLSLSSLFPFSLLSFPLFFLSVSLFFYLSLLFYLFPFFVSFSCFFSRYFLPFSFLFYSNTISFLSNLKSRDQKIANKNQLTPLRAADPQHAWVATSLILRTATQILLPGSSRPPSPSSVFRVHRFSFCLKWSKHKNTFFMFFLL